MFYLNISILCNKYMALFDIVMWYYIKMSEYDIKLELVAVLRQDIIVLCQNIWL